MEERVTNRYKYPGVVAVASSSESTLAAVVLDKGALLSTLVVFDKETGRTICETETIWAFPSASAAGIYYSAGDRGTVRLFAGDGTSEVAGELAGEVMSIASSPSGSRLFIEQYPEQQYDAAYWLIHVGANKKKSRAIELEFHETAWYGIYGVAWLDDHTLFFETDDDIRKATLRGSRITSDERWTRSSDFGVATQPSADPGSGQVAYRRSRAGLLYELFDYLEMRTGVRLPLAASEELVVADAETGNITKCFRLPYYVDPWLAPQWKDDSHLLLLANSSKSREAAWDDEWDEVLEIEIR